MSSILRRTSIVLGLLFIAVICFAVISEYRVFGIVTDMKGKPIEGAKITLKDKDTGRTILIKSKEDGTFDQQFIPHAKYSFSVEKEGYGTKTIEILDFSAVAEKTIQKKIDVQLMTPQEEEQAKYQQEEAKLEKEVAENYQKGVAAFQAKKWDEAIAVMQQVSQKVPERYGPYLILACSYDAKNDLDNAIKYYEKTISLKNDIPDMHLYLGSCYIRKKDYAKAMISYQRLLELRPSDLESRCLLANLQLAVNKSSDAEANIKTAMEAGKDVNGNVDASAALCFKVQSEILLKKGDLKGGASNLRKYLELNPNAEDKSQIMEIIQTLEQTK